MNRLPILNQGVYDFNNVIDYERIYSNKSIIVDSGGHGRVGGHEASSGAEAEI